MWSNECERRAAEMRQRNERDRLASRLGHEQLRIPDLPVKAATLGSTHCSAVPLALGAIRGKKSPWGNRYSTNAGRLNKRDDSCPYKGLKIADHVEPFNNGMYFGAAGNGVVARPGNTAKDAKATLERDRSN
jgi:hypothetical protein